MYNFKCHCFLVIKYHRKLMSVSIYLCICLFWALHINGIIEDVIFCHQLLSLSIVLSRFTHGIACISASFFFLLLNNIPFLDILHFVYRKF